MTDEDYAFLGQVPLFRRLNPQELRSVASTMREERIRAKSVLFEQGDPGTDAFVIKSGKLVVELPLSTAWFPETVARLGVGTVVGEACLVEPAPRSLTVRAVEDTTVYVVDGARFSALRAAMDPGVFRMVRSIALTLCDRLRDNNMKILEHWQGQADGADARTVRGIALPEERSNTWDRLKRLLGWGG